MTANLPKHRAIAPYLIGMLLAMAIGHCAWASSPTITWTIAVGPGGAGSVAYNTDWPVQNGVLTKSGKVKMDYLSMITLTITANPGYKLSAVLKNGTDVTFLFAGDNKETFGPVQNDHKIQVFFTELVPTGDFNLAFPSDPPADLTSIYDLSGTYSGVTPKHGRNYTADVAMDERGKLDGIGSLDGYVPDGTPNASGMVKTMNDQPFASVKIKGKGTRDGVDISGGGTMDGVVNPTSRGTRAVFNDMSGSYSAKLGKTRISDKSVPMSVPLASTASRAWSLLVSITDVAVKKKTLYMASAVLTLPGGEKVTFPAKKVKYSAKKGYKVRLSKGTLPGGLKDRSKIRISNMMFSGTEGSWVVNGGTIQYKFLGQKGTGNLVDLVP